MKETKTELTPAKYKLEQPIVPKRIMHGTDIRINTSLISSILSDSLDRAFDDYVKCIGFSIYEKKISNTEQTNEDFQFAC